MRWLLLNEHVLVEGSAAVGTAALLGARLPRLEGPIALILTGLNVAMSLVQELLSER